MTYPESPMSIYNSRFQSRSSKSQIIIITNTIFRSNFYLQIPRAARLVTTLEFGTSTKVLLTQVGWLSVHQLFVYHSLLLVYKVKQNGKPSFLNKKFSRDFKYRTRQAASNDFVVMETPKCEIGRKSFINTSRKLWNSLPAELKRASQLSIFKNELRDWTMKNISI